MAFKHGIAAKLSIGGVAFEGYLSSAEMTLTRESGDIRVLGETDVVRVLGLRDCTFTANGAFDATADAAIYAGWNGSADVAVVFKPDGVVTYTAQAIIPEYRVTTPSNGAGTWSVNISADGGVVRS